MFFPIGDVNLTRGTKPFLTYILIAINVAVFLWEFSMSPQVQNNFVYDYGAIPLEITHGLDLYTLITNIFLHGSWFHLLGNMLFLWVFGDNIEATLGYGKFIIFYIGGGLVASLTHIVFNPSSQVPCVGASGAIAACLGAYLIMFPKSQIKVLFILLFTTFRVPAIFFLGFWIVQNLFSGIGSLNAATIDSSGVAYWAHIGGFAFGILVGFTNKRKAQSLIN
jgi:membrane associated rhomboid family serine protease